MIAQRSTATLRPAPTRSLVAAVVVVAACVLGVAGVGAAAPAADLAAEIGDALGCACFVDGELRIDKATRLTDLACGCAYAERVRADVAAVAAAIGAGASREAIALAVEEHLLTRSPDYERMLRYDEARYTWFLENVRCLCEGCKATVYFSHCQLTCAPAIVYKRRARVFLALGISVDGIIDYYLAEHNATHAAREHVDRDFLLPKRQRRRGWLVPALAIGGVGLLLAFVLLRLVRRGRGRREGVTVDERAAAVPAEDLAATTGAATDVDGAALSARDRARIDAALDDFDLHGDV